MREPRTITRDTYLKALGMFTIANQNYTLAREIQLRMAAMLGLEDGNCVDDEVYSSETASVRDFDEALGKEKISVEPEPPLSNGE